MEHVDSIDDDVTALARDAGPAVSLDGDAVPTWLDFEAVAADLADDGVSAPDPYVEGIREVIEDADDHGVDLMVVYTEEAAPVYTDARDVATLLNKQFDGTVFVRTPVFTGSSSDTVPRHVLEAGQDDAAREHDPVASATVFAHKITTPALPWGAISAVVLVLVVLATIAFLVAMRRRRR